MKTAKVGSSTTTYVYNAIGQRVKKSGGSAGTVLMFYDEVGHILGEYSSTGALVQETVWMGDIPVATIRPNGSSTTVYNVHADHLNAPRMVTQSSSTNKIAWRWDTDPFATVAPNQNPAGLGTFKYNLRYPGQYFDSETGLFQNYFRDYDPAVGRYVESDPIGLEAGVNTYTYVNGKPTTNYDRDGLEAVAYMSQHPLGLGDGPSWLPPEVKKLVCAAINHCAGNMNCVYNTLNKDRQKEWFDPALRQAENFATAAADDSVIGYPASWAAHYQWGIWYYQYQQKPEKIRLGIPTTPVSDDAYAAGVAGAAFYHVDPSVPLKWCNKCDNH